MDNVIWTPQPKQLEFMQRPEDEALYGGSAGGGKSDALVIEATRQVHIPLGFFNILNTVLSVVPV